MENSQYDLIVAGAGPAGSACAITAARNGARVLLLEKDRFPRHKVCGEFVSSESLPLLNSLLDGEKFQTAPAISAVRIFFPKKTVSFPIAPPARSIPRFELDAALFEAARRSGACTQEGTTVTAVKRNEIFDVQTAKGCFSARAVVNASGRWSQLTRPVASKEKWIGLKAHFTEADAPSSVDLYFFTSGYCGIQPVGPGTVNVCAMIRTDAGHTLQEVFARHQELWQRSRSWEPLFSAVTTSALNFHTPRAKFQGMLMAGDSAGFIDPFAGDGISLALHSGALAAQTLTSFFAGKCSLEHALSRYRAEYFKRLAPAFRSAAWLRKVLSAPSFLQSMVLNMASPFAGTIVRSTRARAS